MNQDAPVDAVVTWVDGNNPAHKDKRNQVLNAVSGQSNDAQGIMSGRITSRFEQRGEIRWCLYSLRKFAPWLRNIFLVTDNQTPGCLDEDACGQLGVSIVDHRDIFKGYEEALPTFNSRAIETMLWRIKNLAENFIYLNDDFVLLRPVAIRDFFMHGRVVLNGRWKWIRPMGAIGRRLEILYSAFLHQFFSRNRTMHLQAQMLGARYAGFRFRYFRTPHVAHPLKTSSFRAYFDTHPGRLHENISHPFRSMDNFWPISLANHLEIRARRAILAKGREAGMFTARMIMKDKAGNLINHIEFQRSPYLCIQEFEQYPPTVQKAVEKALFRLLEIE